MPVSSGMSGNNLISESFRRQETSARRGLMLALLAACAVGVAGLSPHIMYSLSLGHLAYFKSAADEEFYAMYSAFLLAPDSVSFLRRSYLFLALYKLVGDDLSRALVLSDLVFPVVGFLAAYWLARLFFGPRGAIAGAFCLVLGQELLSLGSLAVYKYAGVLSLPGLRAHLPAWALPFFPDYTTYYFGLFRTPEPQISWAGTFVALRLLLSSWLDGHEKTSRIAQILAAHTILPLLYSYCMVGVMVLSAGLASMALLERDYRTFRLLLVGLLMAIIGTAIVASTSIGFVGSQATLLFDSRLPALTASQVFSLGIFFVLFWLQAKGHVQDKYFSLAIAAAAVPVVLMNYQIVTGVMISSRDWERNINFVFVVIAGFVIARSMSFGWNAVHRKKLANALIVVMLVVLTVGQRNVWTMFLHYNEVATAARRALAGAGEIRSDDRIYMADVTWTNLVEIKMNRRLPFSLNFFNTYLASPRPPLTNKDTNPGAGTLYRDVVFDHLYHVGVTPNEFNNILQTEVDNGYGIFLGWFFHFRDWWYPSSDNRMLQKERLSRALPGLVAAYRTYLSNPNPPVGRCWLLTDKTANSMSPAEKARNVLIGTGKGARGILILNLYRQNDCR